MVVFTQVFGQIFGVIYLGLMCMYAYRIAKEKESETTLKELSVLLMCLFGLPMVASLPFLSLFFSNDNIGALWYSPNEDYFIDVKHIFNNVERVSSVDVLVFFADQSVGAIFFDFFEIFRFRFSYLDYSHTNIFANTFLFVYRLVNSVSVASLLFYMLKRSVRKKLSKN